MGGGGPEVRKNNLAGMSRGRESTAREHRREGQGRALVILGLGWAGLSWEPGLRRQTSRNDGMSKSLRRTGGFWG